MLVNVFFFDGFLKYLEFLLSFDVEEGIFEGCVFLFVVVVIIEYVRY